MQKHLSQLTGAGAFSGQHGISSAISFDVAEDSANVCMDMPEDVPAVTGRETGANARPVAIRIASSRRMLKLRFKDQNSQKLATTASSPKLK
jgi:hypothetical protein